MIRMGDFQTGNGPTARNSLNSTGEKKQTRGGDATRMERIAGRGKRGTARELPFLGGFLGRHFLSLLFVLFLFFFFRFLGDFLLALFITVIGFSGHAGDCPFRNLPCSSERARRKWGYRNKEPREISRGSLICYAKSCLNSAHIGRLGAFLTLGDRETHAISFGEGFETIPLNFRKMDEYVGPIVLLDKTKTFCVVKPLHGAFSHFFLHVPLGNFLSCELQPPIK